MGTPMKINILVGGSFYSVMMVEALSAFGEDDVVIYSSAPKRKFMSHGRQLRTRFIPMPASIIQYLSGVALKRFMDADSRLFDWIASLVMRRHDVLHGFATYSLLSGAKTKKNKGVFLLERACPHVLFQEAIIAGEAEKLQIPHQPKDQAWIDRCIAEYDLADVIIVPSRYSYQSFIDRGYSPDKLFIAPLDKRTRMLPPKVWEKKREFVVGMLGGNVVRKGYIYLLEAWKKLDLPDARLLIKASEREIKKSPVLCGLLSECKNVSILPYFDDINDFYRQCDIFCFSSVDDGFGMVAIEAMAASLPIIVTRHVGASDLVEGRNVGFVVDPFDSEQLAEKMSLFYQDRDLIVELGRNAYHAAEEINSEQYAGSYQQHIKRLYDCVVIPMLQSRQ